MEEINYQYNGSLIFNKLQSILIQNQKQNWPKTKMDFWGENKLSIVSELRLSLFNCYMG